MENFDSVTSLVLSREQLRNQLRKSSSFTPVPYPDGRMLLHILLQDMKASWCWRCWGRFELSGEELIPDGQMVGCIDIPGSVSSYNLCLSELCCLKALCAHLVHWEITSSASRDEPGALLTATSWPCSTPVRENWACHYICLVTKDQGLQKGLTEARRTLVWKTFILWISSSVSSRTRAKTVPCTQHW